MGSNESEEKTQQTNVGSLTTSESFRFRGKRLWFLQASFPRRGIAESPPLALLDGFPSSFSIPGSSLHESWTCNVLPVRGKLVRPRSKTRVHDASSCSCRRFLPLSVLLCSSPKIASLVFVGCLRLDHLSRARLGPTPRELLPHDPAHGFNTGLP